MISPRPDEDARRTYWVEQMDAAYDFMMVIAGYPVEECGEAMAPLPNAAEEAGVEVIYSETKNVRNLDRIFYLREGLIASFVALAREMNERGWTLKVEDAYRSRGMQKLLARKENIFDVILQRVIWEQRREIPSSQQMLRRVTALVATSPKVGTHISGSAMDISVLDRDTGAEVPRGGPYLELSELTPMASPFVSLEARKNRDEITALLKRHSFTAYPYEFWHYSQGDAYDEYLNRSSRPGRYGAVDLDLATGKVTPIENPTTPLNSLEEIQEEIEQALKRREPSP